MSAPPSAEAPDAGAPAGGTSGSRPRPEERGSTGVADRVVEKIAARAVTEVDQAAGVSRRVLGVGPSRRGESAQASADVDGDVASVRLVVSVRWPAPVAEVTQRIRERVTARLRELVSLRVAEVDIEVAELSTGRGERQRRVR